MSLLATAMGRRPRRVPGRLPGTSGGFTLVEGVLASLLAGLMMIGIVTWFGDVLQRFSHQEDTLSGAHEAQLLLEWLRRDMAALDGVAASAGVPVSSSATTGTTFPKFWVHACHVPGGSKLLLFPRMRRGEDDPIAPGHPAAAGMALGNPGAIGLLAQIARLENAFAWVAPDDPDAPRFLTLNLRRDDQLERVVYHYEPAARAIVRVDAAGRRTRIAAPSLAGFMATPYLEIVFDPDDPGFVPRLVKAWLEVRFDIVADSGGKIRGRPQVLSTRLFPEFLVASLKSEWGP